ncbi:RHS domain-containing protein [bacterium]|nr:RHS domain-containing protein [bacterium]
MTSEAIFSRKKSSFFLLLFIPLASIFLLTNAHAQVRGWCTVQGGVSGFTCFPDPMSACRAQHASYAPQKNFFGYTGFSQYSRKCQWDTSGATIHPTVVLFLCDFGYDKAGVGRCVPWGEGAAERPQCGDGSNPTGGTNPIILSTGAKIEQVADFQSTDPRFSLIRMYRSSESAQPRVYNTETRRLGSRWRFHFDYSLHLQDRQFALYPQATLYLPDGSSYDFVRQSDGRMAPVGSDAANILPELHFNGVWPTDLNTVPDSSSSWTITFPDRDITVQTAPSGTSGKYSVGKPHRIEYRDGYALSFTYGNLQELQQVTDSFGKAMTFRWNLLDLNPHPPLSGHLLQTVAEVGFPDGSSIRYGYDSPDSTPDPNFTFLERLISAEYFDAQGQSADLVQYRYGDSRFPFAMTSRVDERGIEIASWTYDEFGRATSSRGAGQQRRFDITYGGNSTRPLRTVVNPLGKVTEYEFQKPGRYEASRLTKVTGEESKNCVGSTRHWEYNSEGLISAKIDASGTREERFYDRESRLERIVEGVGSGGEHITEYAWHPRWRLPTRTKRGNLETTYSYSTRGQIRRVEERDSNHGEIRSWDLRYTPQGRLSAIDGPLPGAVDEVRYGYDSNGYLNRITNELGHVQQFTNDGRGNPLRFVDENGVVTRHQFDHRGRLIEMTLDPQGQADIWRIRYFPNGTLREIHAPDGTNTVFLYDENSWLRSVTDPSGHTVSFLRNSYGTITKITVTDSTGQIFAGAWQDSDELGEIIALNGSAGQAWKALRDGRGLITALEEPLGNTARFAYDHLGRVVREKDVLGETVRFQYERGTNLLHHISDARHVTTSLGGDGWGDLLYEVSPDSGSLQLSRTPLGLIEKEVDGRGVITGFTYDHSGRITTEVFPASPRENLSYHYDDTAGQNFGVGRLTRIQDPSGDTQIRYNYQGQITSERKQFAQFQAEVSYRYTAAEEIQTIVYPSGREVNLLRGSDGLPSRIETRWNRGNWQNVISQMEWAPLGLLSTLYSGGTPQNPILSENREYSQDGLLERLTVSSAQGANVIDQRYHYDLAFHLTEIENLALPSTSENYTYSADGRLRSAIGAYGAFLLDQDSSGDRKQLLSIAPNGSIEEENYFYEEDSHRLLSITQNNSERSFRYDQGGYVVEEKKNGSTYAYRYTSRGQIEEVTKNNQIIAQYQYNDQRQLVTRITLGTTEHYIYDLDGLLLAVISPHGEAKREYVWLEEKPVAFFERNTSCALTAPCAYTLYFIQTDFLNRPVQVTDTQGQVVWYAIYSPWGEATPVIAQIELDLRLPGQRYQAETGLHYNWNRHYDPSLGRYLQPDPIGLEGGMHRYLYAYGNPITYIDPDGRIPFFAIGAFFGRIGLGILGRTAAAITYFDFLLPLLGHDTAGCGEFLQNFFNNFLGYDPGEKFIEKNYQRLHTRRRWRKYADWLRRARQIQEKSRRAAPGPQRNFRNDRRGITRYNRNQMNQRRNYQRRIDSRRGNQRGRFNRRF